jgi:hypothetical protein
MEHAGHLEDGVRFLEPHTGHFFGTGHLDAGGGGAEAFFSLLGALHFTGGGHFIGDTRTDLFTFLTIVKTIRPIKTMPSIKLKINASILFTYNQHKVFECYNRKGV